MRRHIYVALKGSWSAHFIVGEGYIDIEGMRFLVLRVAEVNDFAIWEIMPYEPLARNRAIYRRLARLAKLRPALCRGPWTLKQLQVQYPNFVAQYLTDSEGRLMCVRQVAGDPDPTVQIDWVYSPTASEIDNDTSMDPDPDA
jgi:hypothetical protein